MREEQQIVKRISGSIVDFALSGICAGAYMGLAWSAFAGFLYGLGVYFSLSAGVFFAAEWVVFGTIGGVVSGLVAFSVAGLVHGFRPSGVNFTTCVSGAGVCAFAFTVSGLLFCHFLSLDWRNLQQRGYIPFSTGMQTELFQKALFGCFSFGMFVGALAPGLPVKIRRECLRLLRTMGRKVN